MTNKRYGTLIAYKAALDDSYKRINRLSVQTQEYTKTLRESKLAGFKVLRNSKGEHKLIDKTKNENEAEACEMFAEAARR